MTSLEAARTAIGEFARRQAQASATPGMVISLTDGHETAATICVGCSDVAAGKPTTPQTAFGIGSISKTLTAVATLRARDDGLLDLAAPADRYLRSFRLSSGRPAPTLHQLLTHTAGLPSGGLGTGGSRFELARLADMPYFGPVRGWFYSNLGYQILGYVLEEVTGQPHTDLITSQVLRPLGMSGTFMPVRDEGAAERLAIGYQRIDLRPTLPEESARLTGGFSYAGNESAFASTTEDLNRLVRMLLARGAVGESRVLGQDSFQELITGHAQVRPGAGYGYGLYVYHVAGRTWVSHSGNVPGYKAMILADIDAGLGVAVLANGPGDPTPVTRYALAAWSAAAGRKPVPAPPRHRKKAQAPAGLSGVFTGSRGDITVTVAEEEITVGYAGVTCPAAAVSGRGFYVPHPELAEFMFSWPADSRRIDRIFHGPDEYTRTGVGQADRHGEIPPDWVHFLGHYRAYNPWLSNFHVVARTGQLAMLLPSGREQRLHAGPPGCFAVGSPSGPDYLKFDAIVDGKSLRCCYSGADYFRAPWSRAEAASRKCEAAT